MNNNVDNMIVTKDQIDYVDCSNLVSGSTISFSTIPLENVSGAIDKFQQETDARRREIEDLRILTEYSENIIRKEFGYKITLLKREFIIKHNNLVNRVAKNTREINEIRNMLISFIVISIFLTVGFVYCIMNL